MPRLVLKFELHDGSQERFEFFQGPRASEVQLKHWWAYDQQGNARLKEIKYAVAFEAPDAVETGTA